MSLCDDAIATMAAEIGAQPRIIRRALLAAAAPLTAAAATLSDIDGRAIPSFGIGYSDLVGILQGLSNGKHIPAAFVLQDAPGVKGEIEEAPPIVDPKGQPTAQAPPPTAFNGGLK